MDLPGNPWNTSEMSSVRMTLSFMEAMNLGILVFLRQNVGDRSNTRWGRSVTTRTARSLAAAAFWFSPDLMPTLTWAALSMGMSLAQSPTAMVMYPQWRIRNWVTASFISGSARAITTP